MSCVLQWVLQVPAYYGISGNFVTVYVRAEKDSYARRSIYICRGGESVDVLIKRTLTDFCLCIYAHVCVCI